MSILYLFDYEWSVVHLHAERLFEAEVQDHPDQPHHQAKHQAPECTLNYAVLLDKSPKGQLKSAM
jgi:hypothetical protein